ncbi:MAG: hypothetical protein WD898_01835 [Candidatus Paceibacterota bacterium]
MFEKFSKQEQAPTPEEQRAELEKKIQRLEDWKVEVEQGMEMEAHREDAERLEDIKGKIEDAKNELAKLEEMPKAA